jgi:hypothetical protein
MARRLAATAGRLVLALSAMAGLWAMAGLSVLAVAPVSRAQAALGYPGVLENDTPPTVGGDVEVGGAAVAAPGNWSGQGPISYAYQWQDCNPACASIPGATAPAYTPTAADLAARLAVIVTASNQTTSYAVASAPSTAVAPAEAQVQASLLSQLTPHDPTLAVAIGVQTRRGYRLAFDAPVTGRVTVDWYLGTHVPLPVDRAGLVLVAGGSARIRQLGPGVVAVKASARGRKLVKRSRSLKLTAVATVVPTQSLAVSAIAPFTLT